MSHMRPSTAVVRRRKPFTWLSPETNPEIFKWKEHVKALESKEPEPDPDEDPEADSGKDDKKGKGDKKKKKKKKKDADGDAAANNPDLVNGIDLKSPLYSKDLLQPLLELATLLQADKRWEDSSVFIERGLELAVLHRDKNMELYFKMAQAGVDTVSNTQYKKKSNQPARKQSAKTKLISSVQ